MKSIAYQFILFRGGGENKDLCGHASVSSFHNLIWENIASTRFWIWFVWNSSSVTELMPSCSWPYLPTANLLFLFLSPHVMFQCHLFKYVSSAVVIAVLLLLLVVRNCSKQQPMPKTLICALKAVSCSPVASAQFLPYKKHRAISSLVICYLAFYSVLLWKASAYASSCNASCLAHIFPMSCSIGPSAESSEAAVGSGENSTITLLQKASTERQIHSLGRICRCLCLLCAVHVLSGGVAG